MGKIITTVLGITIALCFLFLSCGIKPGEELPFPTSTPSPGLTPSPEPSLSPSPSPTPILNPPESFEPEDAPTTSEVLGRNLISPWGYQKEANRERLYPIVVIGMWGEGAIVSSEVGQKYPAFHVDFSDNASEEAGELIADWLDGALATGLRIDDKRVYLTGFSAGGSGSFKLVRGMLAKGKLFAAIIRVAGKANPS